MTASRLVLFATLISDGLKVTDGALAIVDDRIEFAGNRDDFLARSDASDFTEHPVPRDAVIIPGLVDLHCHGAVGADFSTSDAPSVARAVQHLHSQGTTTLLGSLVTAERDSMLQAAQVLADFAESGDLAGIHAEGPFLSTARCGAQDPRYLSDPDPDFVDELFAATRGQLRTMTYAPELDGSDELVSQLVSYGVVPSLGHTDASSERTADSLRFAREQLASAGVDGFTEKPTVTHLFNGMPAFHHRTPGPVGACLEEAIARNAQVELIADGVHLDPQIVRMVFNLLRADGVILVSDSMSATGLADGDYDLGPQRVMVRDGRALLASDQSLAGGTKTLLQIVRTAVAGGIPLVQAVFAATVNPARLIGLADEVGSLHYGFSADVLVLDHELNLHQTFRRGALIHQG